MPLPLYLAQTSPLSPAEPADDGEFLFPALHANLAAVAAHFAHAAASEPLRDGGVVVFPEYALQGLIPDHSAYALPAPYLLQALQALCKQHRLAAVTTLVEPSRSPAHPALPARSPFVFSPRGELQPAPEDVRAEWAAYEREMQAAGYDSVNTAYYVSGEGDVVGRYEKVSLWHPEREYLKPGSEPSAVFDTPWGKAGLVICWDMAHPDAVQSLVRRGAEIVFAPTYWLSTDSDPIQRKYTPEPPLYDHRLLPALAFVRAFEGECLLVMGNPGVAASPPPSSSAAAADSPIARLLAHARVRAHALNTPDAGFFGQSGVWAPLAGLVGGCGTDEGSWSGRVELEVIKDARRTYKIVEEAHMRAKARRGSSDGGA